MHGFLLAALVAWSSQGEGYASKPLILQIRYGLAAMDFSGRATGWPFRLGHWNWLTATVHNPLDREVEAALTFYTASPQATGRFQTTKRFRLPSMSALRLSFPVRSSMRPDVSAAQSMGVLELRVGGELCDEKRGTISALESNIYPIGVVGDSKGLEGTLNGKSLYPQRGPELESQGIVRSLRLNDDVVPDHPLGFDFLQTLIVVHPGLRQLRPAQWDAIDSWVQAGGNLVVILGSDSASRELPDLRPILPAYPVATRRATVVSSLAKWSGAELNFASGMTLSELLVRSGLVLVAEGDLPLVVSDARGSGTVTCVALDVAPGLFGQPAYQLFWMELLRRLHRWPAVDRARLEPAISSIVEQFAGRQIVGIWLPLVIITAYCSVVGLLVRHVRRRGAGEACWPGICLTAVVLTCVTFGVGWIASPPAERELYDVWVANGSSGSSRFRITDYLAMLPLSRGDTTLGVADRHVQAVPSAEFGASVVDSEIRHDGSSVRFLAEKARRQLVQLDGHVTIDGPRVIAQPEPNAIVLECSNPRRDDIEHAFFMLGRRVVPVGRLAAGEQKVVRIEPTTDAAGNRFEPDQILDSAGRLRRSILNTLFVEPASLRDDDMLVKNFRGNEQGTRSNSLFGGWVSRALDVTWDDSNEPIHSRGLGLLTAQPEWRVPEGGFLVPKWGMTLKLTDPGWRIFYYGKSTFRGDHPFAAPLALEFKIPPWAGAAQIEQAKLFVQFTGEAYRLRVRFQDEWLPLPESSSGEFSIPLSQNESASTPRDALKFQLMVEPRDAFAADKRWQEHRWMLSEFEVECRCTALPQ